MTDYDRDTRLAYRTGERASDYKRYNTTAWSWGRLATAREQRGIRRALGRVSLTANDCILDIPCGTGILAGVLNDLPCRVVASDISHAMMTLGREEYKRDALLGAVQADITRTPFRPGMFSAVCVLGFLHRVPPPIRQAALREVAALSKRLVILTCSVDTPLQRLKHAVLSRLSSRHVPAPHPACLRQVVTECEEVGLRPVRAFMVLPFLSSEAVLILEKSAGREAADRDASLRT